MILNLVGMTTSPFVPKTPRSYHPRFAEVVINPVTL